MGLSGRDSDAALEHDIVESWRHVIDKEALAKRKLGDWVFLPKGTEHRFENDFSAIEATESPYFLGAGIPEVRVNFIDPEDWDANGTMASFSAGSEVAQLREWFRRQGRRARGRKAAGGRANRMLPEPPPGAPMAKPKLKPVGPLQHLQWLRSIRDGSWAYHRWGTGADLRLQWKTTPASTRTRVIEGDAGHGDLDLAIATIEGNADQIAPDTGRKTKVRGCSDLRRYTVNSHPALARAMAKMVAKGEKELVIGTMAHLGPEVVAKFEQVTGRRCVALSVHFDSDLPHWNIWHTGMERVVYPIGEKERVRYRRTSFDLNSSGNLLAWHRTRLAFARLGRRFEEISARTVRELDKGLQRAIRRQNRPPGDWSINEEADRLLEQALRQLGRDQEINEGFAEFVANEEQRYRKGVAGREPKDARRLAVLLKEGETVIVGIERLQQTEQRVAGLERQLAVAHKKVDELEREVGPLRRLENLVAQFVEILRKSGLKLAIELMRLVEKMDEILSRNKRAPASAQKQK